MVPRLKWSRSPAGTQIAGVEDRLRLTVGFSPRLRLDHTTASAAIRARPNSARASVLIVSSSSIRRL